MEYSTSLQNTPYLPQNECTQSQRIVTLPTEYQGLWSCGKRNKTKSEDDHDRYKALRNKVNIMIRESRKQYYEELVQNAVEKGKTIWSVLKKILPKDKTPETLIVKC